MFNHTKYWTFLFYRMSSLEQLYYTVTGYFSDCKLQPIITGVKHSISRDSTVDMITYIAFYSLIFKAHLMNFLCIKFFSQNCQISSYISMLGTIFIVRLLLLNNEQISFQYRTPNAIGDKIICDRTKTTQHLYKWRKKFSSFKGKYFLTQAYFQSLF